MAFKRNIEHLKGREGKFSGVTKDGSGVSIGYGHQLTAEEISSGKYDKYSKENPIPEEMAHELFLKDVEKHDLAADKMLDGKTEGMSDSQKNAVYDAVYQMGVPQLEKKFPSMVQALKDGDWERASMEAQYSNGKTKTKFSAWNEQTPVRIHDFAMRIGNVNNDAITFTKAQDLKGQPMTEVAFVKQGTPQDTKVADIEIDGEFRRTHAETPNPYDEIIEEAVQPSYGQMLSSNEISKPDTLHEVASSPVTMNSMVAKSTPNTLRRDLAASGSPELAPKEIHMNPHRAKMDPHAVALSKPEGGTEDETNRIDAAINQWHTETSIGALMSFTEMLGSDKDEEFDSEFSPTSDPELIGLIESMSPKVAEKITLNAVNKSHFMKLVTLNNAVEEKRAYVAQAFKERPITSFLSGAGTQILEPVNYTPIGLGSLGVKAGMSAGKLLMVKAGKAGIQNALEETVIQSIISGTSITPQDNAGTVVAQSALFGSVFSYGGTFIGKTMKDRKVSKEFSESLELISKETDTELKLKATDSLVLQEELKIKNYGQTSTAHRDALKAYKGKLESDLADARAGRKAVEKIQEVKRHQKRVAKDASDANKRRVVLIEKELEDAKAKYLDTIVKAEEKYAPKANTAVLKRAATGAGVDWKNPKAFRKFKKDYINKVTKKAHTEIEKLQVKADAKLEASLKKYDDAIDESRATLKADTLKASESIPKIEPLKEADMIKEMDLEGSMLTIKDIKSIVTGKAVGAQKVEISDFKQGGKDYNFMPDDEILQDLVYKTHTGANAPKQVSDAILRGAEKATGLDLKDTMATRWLLNKAAIAKGNNPFAAAIYDLIAPSYGRKTGVLSVSEEATKLDNIYLGQLHAIKNNVLDDLQKTKSGGKAWNETNLHFLEHVATKEIRNYLIDPEAFMAKMDMADDVKAVYTKAGNDFKKLTNDHLNALKESGVRGADEITPNEDFFHVSWNNKSARELDAKIGSEKFRELIENSMRNDIKKKLSKVEVDETKAPKEQTRLMDIRDEFTTVPKRGIQYSDVELAAIAKNRAKVHKFHFGLMNVDLEDSLRTANYASFVKRMVKQGTEDPALLKSMKNITEREMRENFGLTGSRKGIDLGTSIDINGKQFPISELLNSNVLETQGRYYKSQNGKIAFANQGIKDTDTLDELLDAAFQYERKSGNISHAQFLEKHMQSDLDSIRYGHGVGLDATDDAKAVIKLLKKYQFTRLLQYTGVSSIAETGALIPEVSMGVYTRQLGNQLKDSIGRTLNVPSSKASTLRKEFSDSLGILTGVGMEDFQQRVPLTGTASRTTDSLFEKALDEMAVATKALSGIEKFNRKVALNSMATALINNIKDGKEASAFFGGLSNTNLAEMGLGSFVGKTFEPNDSYKALQNAFKHITEVDGMQKLNLEKWTPAEKTAFANGITKIMNHILVDPDSITSKGWHNSMIGQMMMQFKSFEVNAASKVTGRAVAVLGDSLRTGDYVESMKFAQKALWSTITGMIALGGTAALSKAGKEDYANEVSSAIWDDEQKLMSLTTGLARSSFASGYVDVLQSAGMAANISSFKNTSSLNPIRRIQQSPTGQSVNAAFGVGASLLEGDALKASQNALKLTPIYRMLGVNYFANMYLDL